MGQLKYLDYDLASDVFSIPTVSFHEQQMISFIKKHCLEENIECKEDDFGNLYITKGILNEDEYYPCITAHLDTVHKKCISLIQDSKPVNFLLTTTKDKEDTVFHIVTSSMYGYGIGGDDKCGVIIALHLLKMLPKLKIVFFSCEEIGCIGSKNMDSTFLNDVGYCIGFDSPEKNRAAHTCMNTVLFTPSFHKQIKDVCDNNGYTVFLSEPFTDIMYIREFATIQCVNFGSGYYNAHTDKEYVILEHVDDAIKLGKELIDKLQYKVYEFDKIEAETDETLDYLHDLGDRNIRCKGLSRREYDEYLAKCYNYGLMELMDVRRRVYAKCNEIGVDFNNFKDIFDLYLNN